MILVLGFCSKDYKGAIKLLDWCHDLDGTDTHHQLLLVGSKGQPTQEFVEVLAKAKTAFQDTTIITPSIPVEGRWPAPCNHLWSTAMRYIKETIKKPWLWLEPDAVPIRRGWFDSIENEYASARKPFLGFLFDKPKPHMTGVGCYPPDPVLLNPALGRLQSHVPFDVTNPEATLRAFHPTNLIQHVWGDIKTNTPPPFAKPSDLELLNNGICLFHRCKDGSLIDLLKSEYSAVPRQSIRTKLTDLLLHQEPSSVPRNVPREIPPEDIPVFVQLGRIGDILNILPMIRYYNSIAYHRDVPVMIHKSMENVLKRVGYVKALPWNGEMTDKDGAFAFAKSTSRNAFLCQLFNGTGVKPPVTSNYNLDQWYNCGLHSLFDAFPLEFIRRAWKTEDDWAGALIPTDRPLLCYNLTGLSSPLKHANLLESAIRKQFGDCELLDLHKAKTPFYTDQLGLVDRCHVLLSIDTSTLHLAQASHCPYVALLSDQEPKGWKATKLRRKPVLSMNYQEVPSRIQDILDVLSMCLSKVFANGAIIHTVPRRFVKDQRLTRVTEAWDKLYNRRLMVPSHIWADKRIASVILGDKRELPFIRDILLAASVQGNSDDIIMFTNDDVVVTELTLRLVRWKLRFQNIVTASRIDIHTKMPSDLSGIGEWSGSRHVGRDLIAFNAGWLQRNMDLIPDFVLGASDWDIVLASIARRECGVPTITKNIGLVFPECELPPGTVLHEKHEALWSKPDNSETAPSQVHNRWLAEEYFRQNNPDMELKWFTRV